MRYAVLSYNHLDGVLTVSVYFGCHVYSGTPDSVRVSQMEAASESIYGVRLGKLVMELALSGCDFVSYVHK